MLSKVLSTANAGLDQLGRYIADLPDQPSLVQELYASLYGGPPPNASGLASPLYRVTCFLFVVLRSLDAREDGVTPVTRLLQRWARCMVGYLGAKAAPSMPADDNDSSVPRVLKALRAFGSAMSAGADAFRLAESKPRVRRSLWLLAPKASLRPLIPSLPQRYAINICEYVIAHGRAKDRCTTEEQRRQIESPAVALWERGVDLFQSWHTEALAASESSSAGAGGTQARYDSVQQLLSHGEQDATYVGQSGSSLVPFS
jgi:hypothetical protein